jgi:hypothetical protein
MFHDEQELTGAILSEHTRLFDAYKRFGTLGPFRVPAIISIAVGQGAFSHSRPVPNIQLWLAISVH